MLGLAVLLPEADAVAADEEADWVLEAAAGDDAGFEVAADTEGTVGKE
jgi:hypothetical protein